MARLKRCDAGRDGTEAESEAEAEAEAGTQACTCDEQLVDTCVGGWQEGQCY